MMIDFALERVRVEHKPAEEAIYEAAVLRFRPIMMTTMSAILVIRRNSHRPPEQTS
jgi:multidrug efflux pump